MLDGETVMKRTLMMVMTVTVALGMMSASFAQTAGPRGGGQQGQGQGQRGGGQGMRMGPEVMQKIEAAHKKVLKELKLNADQTKKVDAAVKKRDEARKKMRDQMMKDREAGKQMDRTALQAAGKKIQDTFNADMKKAMGDANFKKYESRMKEEMKKIMEEAQKKGQGGGGARGGGKTGGN
ncbi:hypothetical protein CCB80_04670 [Armatimonadetes bacterium Uphvl-Ar1]|nr:hypothetical protein CCB80_04670 [Armatimonadetes bacterium Uphvl-Ar1]